MTPSPSAGKIGYVLKRYPRFSETFVVNEILAHEAAGANIEIFALRPTVDAHFQPSIAEVRAAVRYLTSQSVRGPDFWNALAPWLSDQPLAVADLADSIGADALEVYQALELANLVRGRGIEHLHAHFATSATTVARLASLLTGVPYTFTAHAKDIFDNSVNAAALGQKIADAAAVITVSEFNVDQLSARYPQHTDKITCIYNGLPLGRFPFRSTTPATDRPLILAVGRLVEKKGFDELVRACHTLVERKVAFECRIIGDGADAGALRRLIHELHLDNVVTLCGAAMSVQVRELMADAAVFVAPCVTAASGDRDGMPTVLLEAMATGAPCVASDVTGIPEIVRDGETGLLVAERSPAQLAAAIERVLNAPDLGEKFARRARRLMEEKFDSHRNATRIRQLFTPRITAEASPKVLVEA
jgi:colanic acid/amylovoran biosynthesis glycosyltransferase